VKSFRRISQNQVIWQSSSNGNSNVNEYRVVYMGNENNPN